MDAEAKARNLFQMYYDLNKQMTVACSKDCAIMVCDEIINLRMAHAMGAGDNNGSVLDFYTKVKEEIKKL